MIRMVAAAAVLSVLISPSCSRCTSHVDYTIPPTAAVLDRADAVVLARVERFPRVDRYTLEAELLIEDVLVRRPGSALLVTAGERVAVWAYDDPCGRRSGLRLTEGESVIVVLRAIPASKNVGWDTGWYADPVLAVDAGGEVRFLDTGNQLNERIGQIMPEATVDGLLQAVMDSWDS